MLIRMATPISRQPAVSASRPWVKQALTRVGGLTLLMVAFALLQGWAAPRFYGTERVAGFGVGMLHGALMPMALPNLLRGQDVPIFAPNHTGRSYKLGYITGINVCGIFFFGLAFWRPRVA
jgi:hypothetical protein